MADRRDYTMAEIHRIAADWSVGKPIAIIAADHNRPIPGLRAMMKKHRRSFPRRKPNLFWRRVDPQKAKALRAQGMTLAAIGERFGATPVAVHRALRRHA